MKRLVFLIILMCMLQSFSAQTDSLKRTKTSFGVQFGGQLVSEIEQNWFYYYYRYTYFSPFYTAGLYIKHKRSTFDVNFANNRFDPKRSILFWGYNYKFNRNDSKFDLGFGGKLYYAHTKISAGYDKIKYSVYSNYALCYGPTFSKSYNRTTFNLGLYNYLTVSGFNYRYESGPPKLQLLYGGEMSADMILELKWQYRLSK